MKRVTGARSVCLDAYATDSTGKNMILRFKDQTMVLIHIVPGIIPVCWIFCMSMESIVVIQRLVN